MPFKFGAESLCGTVAAANCPLRELLEEEKKVWFPFLAKREGKKKFMHFCFESKQTLTQLKFNKT